MLNLVRPQSLRAGARRVPASRAPPAAWRARCGVPADGLHLLEDGDVLEIDDAGARRAERVPRGPRARRRQGRRRRRRRRAARPAAPLRGRPRAGGAWPSPSTPARSSRGPISSPAAWSPTRSAARSSRTRAARSSRRWTAINPESRTDPAEVKEEVREGFPSIFQALGPPARDPPLRPRDVVDVRPRGGGGDVMAARRPAAAAPSFRRNGGGHVAARSGGARSAARLASFVAPRAPLVRRRIIRATNLGGPLGPLSWPTPLCAPSAWRRTSSRSTLGAVAFAARAAVGQGLGGSRIGGAVAAAVRRRGARAAWLVGGKSTPHGGGWLGGFLGHVLQGAIGAPASLPRASPSRS